LSKIDDVAKQFENAVREAFLRIYGLPSRNEDLRSVRSTWSEEGVKQGWHDPDPGVVLVGTEYSWVQDPWCSDEDHKLWEQVMEMLEKSGWDRVNFESINAAVHIVYWTPPERWQAILNKRIQDRMK
jgi:hypothetical protein